MKIQESRVLIDSTRNESAVRARELHDLAVVLQQLGTDLQVSAHRILCSLQANGRLAFAPEQVHPDIQMHLAAVVAVRKYWRLLGKPESLTSPLEMLGDLKQRLRSIKSPADLDHTGMKLFMFVFTFIGSRLVSCDSLGSAADVGIPSVAVQPASLDDQAIDGLAEILWRTRHLAELSSASGSESMS